MQILLKYKYFILIYLAFVLMRIFAGPLMQEATLLFAGIIVASLLILYIIRVKHQNSSYILAMILAMVGDISLAFMREASFAVSYLAYGLATLGFMSVLRRAKKQEASLMALAFTVVLAIGIVTIAFSQNEYLGLMWTLPAICLLYLSLNMKMGQKNLLTLGAVLFTTSSILCYVGEVFGYSFMLPHIMLYALGQLFICLSLIESYQRAVAKREEQIPKWKKKPKRK